MKTYDETESSPKSDVIRADIEHTRESMDHTMDELGKRMKPRHLLDEVLGFLHLDKMDGQKLKTRVGSAVHSAGQACGRAATSVTDVVREHPIPTLLIGAGVTWAIYEATQRSRDGNGEINDNNKDPHESEHHFEGNWESAGFKEKAQQGAEAAKEGIQSAAQQVKEKATTAGRHLKQGAQAVGQKASEVTSQVVHGVQRGYAAGREKFVQTSQTHPLSVGLGFLAAGVLLGLALPPTRKEDEWVGETSDRMKDRAKAKGEDLVNRGKNVAAAATEAVKTSAGQEGLTPEALKEKAQRVASEAQQAAKRSAEQHGLNPKPESPAPQVAAQ